MISPEDGQSQWRPEDPSWLVRRQLWVHERRGCSGLLLTVMAFPIIGGTSISGGKATIVGSYLMVATGMQSSGPAPWSASCSWRPSSST
jgi:hypothetical protein